ncbi:MAG: hypothetical protein IJI07_06870 [Flexilinea sp.]|nr:hypothetical protein [Flexilinea sp.]
MMKKLILITLSFVFLLAGIASAQDSDIDPLYQDLINELTGILKGQDSGKLTVEKDYSVVISWLTGQPASVKIGYVLKDVDGNGVQELLVGENYGESDAGTVLYDMYTIRDGELLHVFDGWDRNRYYLCDNGNFINQGSSGAMQSNFAYYIYAKGDMIFIRSVIYDATMEPEGPWFISYEVPYIIDVEPSWTEISESDANALNDQFTYVRLDLTPFIQ